MLTSGLQRECVVAEPDSSHRVAILKRVVNNIGLQAVYHKRVGKVNKADGANDASVEPLRRTRPEVAKHGGPELAALGRLQVNCKST